MSKRAKPARDAFTFSLGGMRTIASFVAAPAIANDHINKTRDYRHKQVRDDNERIDPGVGLIGRRSRRLADLQLRRDDFGAPAP